MTTARAGLGVVAVGVIAFLIATVLIGTRATPSPSDGLASRATPSAAASEPAATEDADAGEPGATEDADASEPEAGDDDAAAEAAEQGEGVQRRREAFEAADAVGAAGRREPDPMSRPRPARPRGSARPRSARRRTTGSRPSRPTPHRGSSC